MKRASQILNAEERKAIDDAIAEVEKKTSAEIVVVIATQSGRYDRGEDLFGIVLGIVLMSAAWIFGQRLVPEWGDQYALGLNLVELLAIFIAGFTGGAFLATKVPLLARPFVPREQMRDELRRSAAEAFFRFRIRRTAEATGVLIYISLYERMVWIVGDDRISSEIHDDAWLPVRDRIVDGFRKYEPAKAITDAVRLAGRILTQPFPLRKGDTNEITNEVRFID